jgi:uncharacterized protein involved in exopolysaccharide biosynthesis/Mrp family chromosome partitioning ATPase
MTLRDIYYVVFRHQKKIILFFCSVMMLAIFAAFHMPRIYQSNAQMLIRLGRENATLDPTIAMGSPTVGINESRETEINSDIEVLRSRELTERIIDSLGTNRILYLEGDYKKLPLATRNDSLRIREVAIQTIAKNLTTELVRKTNVIAISFQSRSSQTAHDVIELLILFYQRKHMSIYRPTGSYAFIEQQKNALAEDLKTREAQLRDMRDSTGIISIADKQSSLLTRMNALQADFVDAKANAEGTYAKIKAMEKNIHDMPETMAAHKISGTNLSSSDVLRSRLNEMRVKQLELSAVYSDSSRRIRDIRKQIKQTEILLDSEDVFHNSSNAIRQIQYDVLVERANLASQTARVQGLAAMIGNLQKEVTAFNTNRIPITEMQRQLDIDEANYRKYVDNLEQARIDLDLKDENLSNISVIQAATFPIKSMMGLRILKVILFGMLFGFFGGLSLAFVMEFLDHTIKRVEDVEEYLKLPGLGGIPASAGAIKSWNTLLPNLHTFDTIREKLRLAAQNGKKCQILGVVSCYDGEGSGAVASYLAKSLITRPESGRVLLVDLDKNNPFLHTAFSLPLSPGFSELLKPNAYGAVGPIPVTPVPGLEVLTAGSDIRGALYLGKSERFTVLLDHWKSVYEYVVFVMPAISRSSLVMELTHTVDDVLLVVEAERIRREVISRSIIDLLQSGISIFGVVLNKQRYYVPQWLYKRL